MNETKGTRRETGVFLLCKGNLRKFQSDLLAIFPVGKYKKPSKTDEKKVKQNDRIQMLKHSIKRN